MLYFVQRIATDMAILFKYFICDYLYWTIVRSTCYQQFILCKLAMIDVLWHLIAAICLASQVDVLVKWLKVHSDRVVAVLEHVIPVTSSTS